MKEKMLYGVQYGLHFILLALGAPNSLKTSSGRRDSNPRDQLEKLAFFH